MLLNVILFLPLVAGLLAIGVNARFMRTYALFITALEFALALCLWSDFGSTFGGESSGGFSFITDIALIEHYGISYLVGIDGISLFLVVLSAFVTLVCVIFMSDFPQIKGFLIALLILETTVIGVFIALDVMLFYLFWEFSLAPMLYLIGVFGAERRVYAAVKFFLYTFSASLVMLFGILYFAYVYFESSGVWSFNLLDWYALPLDFELQKWLFLAFFVGIAVKIPMFPLHTWLPYAHGQAPTIGSVILAAILLKMGSYAFVRLSLPLFVDAAAYFALPIAALCAIMVIYTAAIAFVQEDMKQVIAYSSISHMGVIVLGTFALNVAGLSGSVFFMLSHGIISGALFMSVGVLYDRTHTKIIAHYGGVASKMPLFALFFAIALMGSVGLPLTMGFVGEFLSLLGFSSVNLALTLLCGSGVILGAVYMLNLFRNVFLGEANPAANPANPANPKTAQLPDLNPREKVALGALVAVVIWLGVYPKPVLSPIEKSAQDIIAFMFEKSQLDATREFLENANRSE